MTNQKIDLEKYAAKHNYEILEEYTTMGDKHTNYRAIVRHKGTGEKFYLYYDPSRRNKFDIDSKVRGWRNTTLDNKRAKLLSALRYDEYKRSLIHGYEMEEMLIDVNSYYMYFMTSRLRDIRYPYQFPQLDEYYSYARKL